MRQNNHTFTAPASVVADSAVASVIQSNWPPVLGVESLSQLILQSTPTILANRSRAPWKLPPSCTPTSTRQPLWLLTDVLVWIASFRVETTTAPVLKLTKSGVTPDSQRGRGLK